MPNTIHKNRPYFSIIIPNYNREEYIGRSINSVLSQDFLNFEILVIDGKSTDNSHKIIRNLTKDDSRIRLINEPVDTCLSDAINIGISHAKGDYAIWLGSDDRLADKNVLKTLFNFISANNKSSINKITLCYGSYYIHHEKRNIFEKRAKNKLDMFLMKFNNTIGCSNAAFDPEFCRKNNIKVKLDLPLTMDYDLLLQIIKASSSPSCIVCVPLYTIIFRLNADTISGKNTYKMTMEGAKVACRYSKSNADRLGIVLFNVMQLIAQWIRKLYL